MKGKAWKIVALVCALLVAGLLIWNLTDRATVFVDGAPAKVSLSKSWKLRSLLVGVPEPAGAGCPFSPEYSVCVGGLTHCLSKDDCESVWIKELNVYYTLQQERFSRLEEELLKVWEDQLRPDVSNYSVATFEKKGEDGYKQITSEISSLYTFDSLCLCPMMDYVPQGDWLYRLVLGEGELELLFWENVVTANGKVYAPAEGVSSGSILNWAAGKYDSFHYELEKSEGHRH